LCKMRKGPEESSTVLLRSRARMAAGGTVVSMTDMGSTMREAISRVKDRTQMDCTRRLWLLGLTGWLASRQADAWAGLESKSGKGGKPALRPARILIMGDSLSAEYGLPRGAGWVALLQARLAERHIQADVVNASISGETTAGGKTRLPALLQTHQPTHVVIELGANDALRGLALKNTQDNLQAMIGQSQQAGAQVVLVGMMVPPNFGKHYTDDFSHLFGKLAGQNKTALVPFLLQGIADRPDARDWFQADGIHPQAKGHPIMLNQVWQALGPLL
jgi:acyl-CoA thioesterase-1